MKDITLPLFPLNGVILFPNSNLPLNIFEKRYLNMIDFALTSNRMIGMIQTNKKGELYSIDCSGKINSFSETEDGRYVINLIGNNYFKIDKKLKKSKSFILASVNIENVDEEKSKNDLKNFNKKNLIEKYKNFIKDEEIKIDFELINQIETGELIKFISMSCPFSTEDKQMLLETYNINELGNKLINLFEFYPGSENENKSIN